SSNKLHHAVGHDPLRAYTGGRSFTFSRLERKAPEPVAVTVRELPASADDLLLMMAMLDTRGGALADRTSALARVQVAAARHPGDALATRTLAMAELYLGDANKAVALLDDLMTAAPDDAELLRLKAQALLRLDFATNRGDARRLLVRAVKAVPNDWRAMHIYIHTHDIAHADLANSVFDVVQAMAGLAPQVDGVVIDLATVLVRRRRFADAAKVLEPLAYAPHGGRIANWAILLRNAAVESDGKRFVDLLDQGPPKDELPPAAPK
ncbi:tetratricopeptide repeat protein, partial [Sandarakinorhabdus cyanobacteriorum]|uniref:tetratricopeptide repeat protein n=1 Tax=Sandarakinorhabdus cyanobacteriorum TaxID=1981098 RepID=UPI001A9C3A18